MERKVCAADAVRHQSPPVTGTAGSSIIHGQAAAGLLFLNRSFCSTATQTPVFAQGASRAAALHDWLVLSSEPLMNRPLSG
jgi:hypothetical protein